MTPFGATGLVAAIAFLVVGKVQAQELMTPPPAWIPAMDAPAVQLSAAASIQVPDSLRVKLGYQHWRGAAIGAGIGGALGAVVALLLPQGECADCGEQISDGTRALYGGLIVAGAGGVVGFFTGLASPRYAPRPAGRPPR